MHLKSLPIWPQICSNPSSSRQSIPDCMPLLDYVLAGIKQAESRVATHTDSRLPITIQVLRSLKLVWLSPPSHPDSIMLWAASCVGFFGFLRAGEFTVPSPRSYDASVHLSLSDLAVDSHTTPSMIRLRIKQSKTDPCRRGWPFFYLGGGEQRMQTFVQFKPCYSFWIVQSTTRSFVSIPIGVPS